VSVSASENRELLQRYISEVWEAGNLDAIHGFLSPGFKRHISPAAEPLDTAQQVERLRGLREAFPDVTIEVEDIVVEENRIAFRSVMRGTHSGEFMGLAPTGRQITVGLVDIIRVESGQFAEQWGGPDMLDLVKQLGATPGA
jgi:steroid delta-isomerase-like uncharacterized protein